MNNKKPTFASFLLGILSKVDECSKRMKTNIANEEVF